MENKSDFIPNACSTVTKKKIKKMFSDSSNIFNEETSLFSINESMQRDRTLAEVSSQLEEQRHLAQTSLQRANKVVAIPSKYFRANFSKLETTTNVSNESTVSESDLLQTPRNASTPRNSIQSQSILGESLAQLSSKVNDANFTIDNLLNDFKKVMKNADDQKKSIFKPGEEAASMLFADEMSWRQKNAMPVEVEQFSQMESIGKESLGDFFQKRCNTLSEFPGGASPNVTREPVPLIEPSASVSIVNEGIVEGKQKKSLSISMIQRFLADSNYSPKRAADNMFKLSENEDEFVCQESKPINSLSVSKNSSYTSDHSDNDAMKQICNKENINSLNVKTPSTRSVSPSSRSSSALSSLESGKLPIEATRCELVWGCVKVGKSILQEFILRNRSAKRLGLQLSLSSQEFKIRKDNRSESEALSSNKILLHPHESKAIIVSFNPTKWGAAVDELYFTSLDPNLKQSKKQCVRLFGYGGSFKTEFSNLTRDTTGRFWLSLGKLDARSIITSSFTIKNKGDVPVFIYISIQSLEASKLDVNPHFFVIMPQIQKEIVINYRPSNEDYNFLHKSFNNTMIVDLGNLDVRFGTEVDRGRLRKIYEKCIETGFKTDSLAKVLREKIDGEIMPLDLLKFKESPASLKDLLKLFSHHQIVLTLERDPEQTIVQQFSDDSGLYQSLCQENTFIHNKTGALNSCYIAPPIIILTLPYKYKDTVFLKSENEQKLNFRVSCHNELEVKPKEGILEPHGTVVLNVKYHSSGTAREKKCLKVLINVENEMFEVDIKIEFLGQVKNKNKSILNCM